MKATTPLALLLLAAVPAHAAEDPLPADGMVEALPLDEVVGDGQTPVTVHLLALKPDGSPMEGLEVKLKSKATKDISGWSYDGDGIYSFQVRPPKVLDEDTMWVRVKGKTVDKAFKVDVSAKLPLRPSPPLALTMTTNPAELVAGEREEATLSLTLADGRDVDPELLNIRTTRGEVGEIVAMGGGRYVAKVKVEDATQPGLALVTVSDRRRPERMYGVLAIPITAKKTIYARAPWKSSVLLKVDGREFGPVESRKGRARIDDVVVPPGITEGTQVTVKDGTPAETPLDLDVRPSKRLLLVPTFDGVPADPGIEIPVRLYVVQQDGAPDASAEPVIETSAGTITSVTHEGNGVYLATLKPDASTDVREVRLTASLPDEKGQEDSLTLKMTPARPASLAVSVDPDPLGDSKAATVQVEAKAASGEGLPTKVSLNLTGAKADGAWSTSADGGSGRITTFGGPVELRVSAQTAATGNPLHQLVIHPSRSWIPNDDISSTMVTVVALDIFGYPVEGVPVRMLLARGDGDLPQEVTTDAFGMAQVFYSAGDDTDLIRIRAISGEASAATAILQGPSALSGVVLPRSGSEAQRALTAAWEKMLVSVRVETE